MSPDSAHAQKMPFLEHEQYRNSSTHDQFHQWQSSAQPDISKLKAADALPVGLPRSSSSDRGFTKEPEVTTLQLLQDVRSPDVQYSLLRLSQIWILEFICLLIATAGLAAIALLLLAYNNQLLTEWPFSTALSTVLSIITTVAIKTSLAVPITSGLAQLKWSRSYQESERLPRFAAIHSASTSVLSSLVLLFSMPSISLASLGALIGIATLGFSPTIQQSLKVGLTQTNSPIAKIPAFTALYVPVSYQILSAGSPGSQFGIPGSIKATEAMTEIIYTGLFGVGTSKSVTPTCPTGNCVFDIYQSLGICSKCANVTASLTVRSSYNGPIVDPSRCFNIDASGSRDLSSGIQCVSQLPNGLGVSTTNSTFLNATLGGSLVDPDLLALPGFANLSIIFPGNYQASAQLRPTNYTAYQCSLYFCPMQYNSSVIDGLLSESISVIPATTNYLWGNQVRLYNTTLTPKSCISPLEKNCTYLIEAATTNGYATTIAGVLTGSASVYRGVPSFETDAMALLYRNGHEAVLNSLASTMTTYMRTTLSNMTITGTALDTVSYYHVNWLFLLFPAIVILLAFVFLFSVAITTRRQYLWKDSSLAILLAGQHLALTGPDTKHLTQETKGVCVKLDEDGIFKRM